MTDNRHVRIKCWDYTTLHKDYKNQIRCILICRLRRLVFHKAYLSDWSRFQTSLSLKTKRRDINSDTETFIHALRRLKLIFHPATQQDMSLVMWSFWILITVRSNTRKSVKNSNCVKKGCRLTDTRRNVLCWNHTRKSAPGRVKRPRGAFSTLSATTACIYATLFLIIHPKIKNKP